MFSKKVENTFSPTYLQMTGSHLYQNLSEVPVFLITVYSWLNFGLSWMNEIDLYGLSP